MHLTVNILNKHEGPGQFHLHSTRVSLNFFKSYCADISVRLLVKVPNDLEGHGQGYSYSIGVFSIPRYMTGENFATLDLFCPKLVC